MWNVLNTNVENKNKTSQILIIILPKYLQLSSKPKIISEENLQHGIFLKKGKNENQKKAVSKERIQENFGHSKIYKKVSLTEKKMLL